MSKDDPALSGLRTNQLKHFDDVSNDLEEFLKHIELAAAALSKLTKSFHPNEASMNHWERLVEEWAEDKTMPLYIRKTNAETPRGTVIEHVSGRKLIPCDNGPAHWAFSMCVNENMISLSRVNTLIDADRIPVAFALSKHEKNGQYRFNKHEVDKPNEKGWKISHKEPIGLNTKKPLSQIELDLLKMHFIKFMSPSNMFLMPLRFAGLAELEEVIEVFRASSLI